MRIYRLVYAGGSYEGVAPHGQSEEVTSSFYRTLTKFGGDSVADIWQPFSLSVGSEPGHNEDGLDLPADCPHFGFQTVVLKTDAAIDGLGPLLEPWGELLPAQLSTGPIWFFNGLHVVDALDTDRSRIIWDDVEGTVMMIKDYVFLPEAIGSTKIFKLENYRLQLHFTGEFVDEAMALGLTGLAFKLLWTDEDQ